ncbi:SPOR domain-containing protein [Niveibacterium terrae]|uniref:SPOR domain-containing protein n=1 Tax=Niveibacterium terrae TaxID=3373598 RepID=UPI003A91C73C
MADNEPQIELKKRARRRLVGASALALLAAIVLPMVMEHEPRQAGQDIQVRIPSQEGANYAARVIRGQDPAPVRPSLPAQASAPLVATTPAEAPAALVSSPLVPPPPPKGERSERDEREAAKAQERKLTAAHDAQAAVKELARREEIQARKEQEARKEKEARKEAALAEAAKAKRDTESAGKPHGRDNDSSRAAAILNDDGASAKSSRFVIQLGSFKDPANAASLRGKASAEGIGAYVESAGDKTRVRAGPYPSREAAEAAAARLRKAGLSATVTPAS